MRVTDLSVRAFGIAAVIVMLVGCGGGSQPQLSPAGLPQQSGVRSTGAARGGAVIPRPDRSRSWMAPGAATTDLLYISDLAANEVFVYSYPGDKLVGKLTGFHFPDGECTDKLGDVWIVNNEGSQSSEDIVEYKHGGTKPIATLYDPGVYPVSCSVDPTTGDLAVTASEGVVSHGPGNVAIFRRAKGNPTYYQDPAFYFYFWDGYDTKGNLYIDGSTYQTFFEFAELPKGEKKLKTITLKGGAINFGGKIQWDGKYVAVGEQEYKIVGSPPHYDSAIYQTTGSGGKIVSVTPLDGSMDVGGPWIDGQTVIGPSSKANGSSGGIVGFWNYPKGGKFTKKLTGFDQPYSAVISRAQ